MKKRPPHGPAWGLALPIALSLLYGASPVDLVPDLLPLLGWADDGAVALLLVGLAFLSLARRRKAQALAARPAPAVGYDRAA
jgi:uncharacterized membrane protein YkvA (DUF1232 family)